MYIVQIIALAVYVLVMIGALRDFKRTILIWVPMSLLFSPQVCVLYNNPITALTVALNISLVIIYFFHVKGRFSKYGLRDDRFFFSSAINLMLISYVVSTLFSSIPFAFSFNRTIKAFLDQYGILILLFRCINTKDDIILYLKISVIAMLIAVGDGLVEFVSKVNIIGDFYYFYSKCDESTLGRGWHIPYWISGSYVERFGLIRCYSVFQLHLLFGFACCMWTFITIFCQKNQIIINNKFKHSNSTIISVLIFLSMVGCIICNSKGPLICLMFILLSEYSFKSIFRLKFIIPIMILFVVIFVYFPDYLNNIFSLFDDEIAEEGRGSTVGGRENQFDIAMQIFSMNPITGMGINSGNYFKSISINYAGLLGSESVWLKLLPDQGLFGVFAYLYMYYLIFKNLHITIGRRRVLYFLAAIFIYDTTNGHSIDHIVWWLGPLIAILRYYELRNYKL